MNSWRFLYQVEDMLSIIIIFKEKAIPQVPFLAG